MARTDQRVDSATSDGRRWSDWTPSQAFTVGVEEEVMLVDGRDWALTQRIEDVRGRLAIEVAPFVGAGTHQAAIELSIAARPHAVALARVRELEGVRALLEAPSAELQRQRVAGDGMTSMVATQAEDFETAAAPG